MWVGDVQIEDTIDIKFNTVQFSTGAPFTLASGAVEIYEANSITQITTAETLTVDFDSVTGLHNLRVACTAANGFEVGKDYSAVMSAGTVDSVSVVGMVIANFSVEHRAPVADTNAILVDTADMQPKLGTPAGASISADIATVDTVVDAVKAKTDQLTFTKANELDSNIQSVNGTEITGDGGSGTEWGPV